MIFELPNTNTREISKTLVKARETGGQVTTSRVLTLIIVAEASDDIEAIKRATTEASREHPSRVILLVTGDRNAEGSSIDASVSIGGDAGASELVVMHLAGRVSRHLVHVVTPLLLPDTPIVAWWPSLAPEDPGSDRIGEIAQRRITDALYDPPADALYNRRNSYTPGDSDLAWARLTPWRGLVASSLDQPPHEAVERVRIYGCPESPSVDLAAGWLSDRLRVPVERHATDDQLEDFDDSGLVSVPVRRLELDRPSGTVVLELLADGETLAVDIPGRERALVAVNRRSEADCLAEELRHLDPDLAYKRALRGLSKVRFITG